MEVNDVSKELNALRLENELLKKELVEFRYATENLPMTLDEYKRYGRQMIVEDSNGVDGQLKLRNSKVLVVGAGGLGCPALLYLAGAGIGHIGIVDDDTVDISNLHRQVLHNSNKVGMLKCNSAKEVLNSLNPHVTIDTYPLRLNHENAFEIFEKYEIILDCTDTPSTRYLISDVAVNLGLTVVSGSGLRTEGQLSILNFQNLGPCYRCFYPQPPSPNSVTSCQEGGIIGPCIGIIGVMMAVETIKLILGIYTSENFQPFLMMYSGFPHQTLRTFRMRNKQKNCECCRENSVITRSNIEEGKINYDLFCGSRNYNVCSSTERISVDDFEKDYLQNVNRSFILLDVRPHHHYDISHLPSSFNLTVKELRDMEGDINKLRIHVPSIDIHKEVILLCRHGNDSQLATKILKNEFGIGNSKDVIGGLFKYIDDINSSIPKY